MARITGLMICSKVCGCRVEETLNQHALTDAGELEVQLQCTRCLMSCKRSCSAALHQSGKASYVLARIPPLQFAEAAERAESE